MKHLSEILSLPRVVNKKDKYLDALLTVINTSRSEAGYKPYTYPRLQKDLQKLGKSKKNWNRDIFIASILDAPNPPATFFSKLKQVRSS